MRIRLRGPGHAASLLGELNRCRQSRRYCDVFLQVGNRSFAAHRAVLACAGTYFRNLFGRTPASAASTPAAFSLEFISPANFEKVLTFVYTGEILTDLIDVGVLYELAERLGVAELVKACYATFPDLQTSADCKSSSPGSLLDSGMVAASSSTAAAASASSACSSSAASCSSLSSPAAPTPAAAASPLFQASRASRVGRDAHTEPLTLDLKAEDLQSHVGYGQITEDHLLTVRTPPPPLQLKTEQQEEEDAAERLAASEPRSGDPTPSDSCSFPDSSAPLASEACAPSSSSGEASGLQVAAVEGGVGAVADGGGGLMFGEVEEEVEDREVLPGNGAMDGAEEEQWRQLAGEIIELSDDENFMEEGDEEEDDDLVYVENGASGQVPGSSLLSCKTCSAQLPADPAAIHRHGESHLTDLGLCRVCGASFPDRGAGVAHALNHVGVQLFTCEMCQQQFFSLTRLLRHHRQTASGYAIPPAALTTGQVQNPELQCAVCSRTLSKDFQSVRDHLLSHVCPQALSCGVCPAPQPSLCSLLWHGLAHLALPVFSCPHCARCFVERCQLDRHMAAHAEEAAAKERERSALRAYPGGVGTATEELHCFLCPQVFRSSSAFQYHLSLHTSDSMGGVGGVGVSQSWTGKRKADQPLDGLPKISSLGMGLGMSFSLQDKFFSGPMHVPNGGGPDATGAVRGKWYRCRYCGKRFAHSGEFTYHLRIHTGEKPYQCKVCLRFFRGRSTMICHLKTHAGALMYRCTVCGLYFSTLKMVSSHMELHKDQLPPDFNIEQTFMYNDHSKETLPTTDT